MATYSISGTISPLSFVNVATTIVNACSVGDNDTNGVQVAPNANGTYTIPNLPADTYIIQVGGPNFLVSPSSQTVVITAANVTGINFTCAAAPSIGIFAPIFSDTFIRANENPLSDGGAWSPPNNNTGLITSTYLQILNDQCTSRLANTNDGTAAYVDVSPFPVLPPDQYSSVKISELGAAGNLYLYVRGTLPGIGSGNPALYVTYILFVGNSGGPDAWGVYAIDDAGSNTPYTWVTGQATTISIGDIWTLGIAGQGANGVLYVYQNGTCLWQASIAPNPDLALMNANGTVGLQLDLFTPAQNDIAVTNFLAGGFAVTGSPTPTSIQTPTTVTDYGQIYLPHGSPQSIMGLPNPLSLDLLQIVGEGGDILVNCSWGGMITQNPAVYTSQCLFGRYYSRLGNTAMIAQIFADAFYNNRSQQDILQIRGQGGNGIFHISYQGIAYNS